MPAEKQPAYIQKFKINKDSAIVLRFLESYWKRFIELNEGREKLFLPSRADLIKESGFKKRNGFKHLSHLVYANIFFESGKGLLPAAFIFKVNDKTFNPSSYFLQQELPETLETEHEINLKVSVSLAKKVFGLFKTKQKPLAALLHSRVISASSFSTSFNFNDIPKSVRIFSCWRQKNKKIMQEEQKLFDLLGENALGLNCLAHVKPNFFSTLIELDELNQDYVIAGDFRRLVYEKTTGKQLNNGLWPELDLNELDLGSRIVFFDSRKQKIGEEKITFPQDPEGVAFTPDDLIRTPVKAMKVKNPNFIGWYLFKNEFFRTKTHSRHRLVSFSRLSVPENTKFMKIDMKEKNIDLGNAWNYFNLINIIPLKQFPVNFIKKYCSDYDNKAFIQNTLTPFIFPEAKEIDKSKVKNITELMAKLSWLPEEKRLKYMIEAKQEMAGLLPEFEKIINSGRVSSEFAALFFSVGNRLVKLLRNTSLIEPVDQKTIGKIISLISKLIKLNPTYDLLQLRSYVFGSFNPASPNLRLYLGEVKQALQKLPRQEFLSTYLYVLGSHFAYATVFYFQSKSQGQMTWFYNEFIDTLTQFQNFIENHEKRTELLSLLSFLKSQTAFYEYSNVLSKIKYNAMVTHNPLLEEAYTDFESLRNRLF